MLGFLGCVTFDREESVFPFFGAGVGKGAELGTSFWEPGTPDRHPRPPLHLLLLVLQPAPAHKRLNT